MDYLTLSKIISQALRHTPEKYEMVLDKDGWGDVNILLRSIAKQHAAYAAVTHADIVIATKESEKKRHEIKDGKIRALYGHTIDSKIEKESVPPPMFLYHGTNTNSVKKIKSEGLKKMNRQYVHLSANIEEAKQVALRKTTNPVILIIKALEAANSGMIFYKEKSIWLCDFIHPDFIELQN